MKILYHFRTRGTGPESVHIAGMAKAFQELGRAVTFSSPTGVNPLESEGANPYGSTARKGFVRRIVDFCPGFLFELLEIGYNLAAWRRNAALLRQGEFELIYERHAFFLFSTAVVARRRKIPLVIEVNELVGDDRVRKQPFLTSLARRCDRVAFERATLIVVVAPHLKRRIEGMGINAGKILVLPNAIDAEECRVVADGIRVREAHGVRREAIVIGFVGWFVKWHQLDKLIAVFAELASAESDLHLLMVGDGELRGELEAQAAELGVTSRIILSGAVSHADIPKHIGAMDICVVPHSNEFRSPIKLFEYMGQGKVVVAPATEPIATVIRDRENGLLFSPDSQEEMRGQLKSAVNDADLRGRLKEQARQDALKNHTWKRNAERALEAVRGELAESK